MNRRILQLASLACLGSLAHAQGVDLSQVHPLPTVPRHAGVFNLRTGRFAIAGGQAQTALVQTVYNNTCLGGGGYVGDADCEDRYDEGRVPSQVGTTHYPDHDLESIEIAYCTSAVTGTVDLDWELYDTQSGLGGAGSCTFGSAGTPPVFTLGLTGFDSSATGFPLPGSTALGAAACWIVGFSTGTANVCLTAGPTSADPFIFRFSQNNSPTQLGGGAAGTILAGDPVAGPAGCGTFGNPPCVDPSTFAQCGNGLDTQDLFWVNIDNTPVGGTPPANCAGASSGGTGCYWFGGYPTNPYASLYLKLEGDGSCTTPTVVTAYCTAKVNSLGCTPTVSWSGFPVVASCATNAFNLTASNLVGNKNGLWFYGTNGLSGIAFQGGHLCIKPAIKRLNVQNSGGQGSACNGSLTTNFNARICSGSDSALIPGALVGTQCWSRDPASPSTTNLTSAISFIIAP